MSGAAAEWVHVDKLRPWDRNPRHNDDAARQIANNISEYGFTAPIVVQSGTDRIIAGHTRQKAVRILLQRDPSWTAPGAPGPGMVPARFVDVDDETATRLTIADNRLGDLAVWDEDMLASLLDELPDQGLDLLGFDEQELSALTGQWEDPFADMGSTHTTEQPAVEDNGTARIVVQLPITSAQDASIAFREALDGLGVKSSQYKLEVT